MQNDNIQHFDATAKRREKMQQASRDGAAGKAISATPALPPTSPATDEECASQPSVSQPTDFKLAPAGNPTPDAISNQPPAAPIDAAELESFLIKFVVEQTGYPEEIVELDADLEADLGIDSIKKAQMFGELREDFAFEVDDSSSLSLDDFPTLRDIMQFLQQATSRANNLEPAQRLAAPKSNAAAPQPNSTLDRPAPNTPAPTPAPLSPASMEISANTAGEREDLAPFLVNFVVEQTGYPAEIVEMDADLEADLGIDSIKKAQMFGELREVFSFQIEVSEGMSLSDFPTLRHILQFLEQHSGPYDGQDGNQSSQSFDAGNGEAIDVASQPVLEAPSTCEASHQEANAPSRDDNNSQGIPRRSQSGQPNRSRPLNRMTAGLANDASVLDALRRILIEQGIADAARVNLTRRTKLMDDVGLDSIGMLDLIQAVEREFDISISLDDMDLKGLNAASAFAALIQRKLAGMA